MNRQTGNGLLGLSGNALLRLSQIIGEVEITEEQAAANREYNRRAEVEAIKMGRVDENGKAKFARRPTTPRVAIMPIVPVSKTTWYDGVKSGRFPQPVKISSKASAWRASDIQKLIAEGVAA